MSEHETVMKCFERKPRKVGFRKPQELLRILNGIFPEEIAVDLFYDLTLEEKQEAIEEALREIAEHNKRKL